MANQLFPVEFLENSVEAYIPQLTLRTRLLYTSCLLILGVASIALPFIYVDISIQSAGIIRTVSEKTEIKPLFSGHIHSWNIKENQRVHRGQTLLVLATAQLDSKLKINLFQQREQRRFLSDLNALTEKHIEKLQTPLYKQQWYEFQSQLITLQTENTLLRREYETDQQLYADRVIARQEFERKENAYRRKETEIQALTERQLANWEMAKKDHYLALINLEGEEKQVLAEKKLYTLYAPVAGTIQQVIGKYPNGYIQAGEVVGEISPDSSLLAECYITPRDIGFIKKSMSVQFQIETFNYNEWGLIPGKVIDIGDDFILIDKHPTYVVKCTLQKHSLKLANGYIGQLKKGMTLQGRFTIARRSLYQLLYDKVDDWINPKLK